MTEQAQWFLAAVQQPDLDVKQQAYNVNFN